MLSTHVVLKTTLIQDLHIDDALMVVCFSSSKREKLFYCVQNILFPSHNIKRIMLQVVYVYDAWFSASLPGFYRKY